MSRWVLSLLRLPDTAPERKADRPESILKCFFGALKFVIFGAGWRRRQHRRRRSLRRSKWRAWLPSSSRQRRCSCRQLPCSFRRRQALQCSCQKLPCSFPWWPAAIQRPPWGCTLSPWVSYLACHLRCHISSFRSCSSCRSRSRCSCSIPLP